MATLVWTDANVLINAVDLSPSVRSATLTFDAEMLDETVMGAATTRLNKPGLFNWNLEVEFLQDYATGAFPDDTLFSLVGAAAFVVAIRPTSAVISATNPEYTGNAVIATYNPLAGLVGDLAVTTVRFMSAGALTLDITP